MICPNPRCGYSNSDGMEFCDQCGTPLNTLSAGKERMGGGICSSPGPGELMTAHGLPDIFAPPTTADQKSGKRRTEAEAFAASRPRQHPTEHETPDVFDPPTTAGQKSEKRKTVYDLDQGPASDASTSELGARSAGRRIVGWLITFDGDPDGTSHTLREGRTFIGHDPDSDIVVSDPKVSAKHATIILRAGTQIITDDASMNGTYVNDLDIKAHTSKDLKGGDVIRVGDTRFVCHLLDREIVTTLWKR
jgi:hypothetical protein